MIKEDRQLIESHINEGEINREAGDFGSAKISYEKALDEFHRIQEESGDSKFPSGEAEELKKQILEHLAEVNTKLSFKHKELGLAALESKDFPRAIDELEEAIDLGSENDIKFLEECKKFLDAARIKDRDQKIYSEVSSFVSRGDEFKESGNYGEAVLEYQEALKALAGLPADHRFVAYIQTVLRDCRRSLIRPYLRNIYDAVSNEKYRKAYRILQNVFLLIDEKDFPYRAFFDRMKEDIVPPLSKEDIVEEDNEAPETWGIAIKDYEEALDLYSSYTVSDPLSPVYTSGNIYEDRFLKSRRNLASLYRKRADKLRENADIRKALKNYKEALKLFPRADKEFHDTFREMKRLRAQLTHKEG